MTRPGEVQRTVAVVGAGVAGLSCAYELIERSQRGGDPTQVICFESGPRTGGDIRTESAEGFLCEWGPNGFLDSARTTLTLVRRLGLHDRLQPADASAGSRFVYRDGRLRALPTSAGAFLRSDVLTWPGKLRVLMEPWMRKGAADADESVYAFASRRIGRNAATVLVDALVSGIYAGDVRELSLSATFPKIRRMEQEHGSLFSAMLAMRKRNIEDEEATDDEMPEGDPGGSAGRLTSFRGGMQDLIDALTVEVGDRLRLNTAVRSVADMGLRGFRLLFDEGAPMDVDAVILACPAWHAAPLVESMDPELAAAMNAIPGAPLAVVHCGYRTEGLGEQPEGFGLLVPRGQNLRILGSIWASDIFPGRAPGGSRLITTMIGGAHDPQALELSDTELVDAVRHDLERCMGIAVRPYMTRVFRHERGIPQYTLGHRSRLDTIDQRLDEHAGLWIAGNSYRGIAVNACIEEAPRIAEAALDHLAGRPRASHAL